MSGKLLPALIAGFATFIISFIMGLIPIVGCCAIIMPVVGGLFAVFLYSNNANVLTPGVGTGVGLMAGGVHAVLSILINPIVLYIRWNTMQMQLEPLMEQMRRNGMPMEGTGLIVLIIISIVIGIAIVLGLYALGGLIGGAIFKKQDQSQTPFEPPMPPPSYGV